MAYKAEIQFSRNIKKRQEQIEFFLLNSDISRAAYNWALNKRVEYFLQTKKSLPFSEISKEWTKIFREKYPWMINGIQKVTRIAFLDLKEGFDRFFENRIKNPELFKKINRNTRDKIKRYNNKNQNKKEFNYPVDLAFHPKFKKKGKCKKSFSFQGVNIQNNKVYIPKLGWMKLKEEGYIPDTYDVGKRVNVTYVAGKWFISFAVKINRELIVNGKITKNNIAGIDWGIRKQLTIVQGDKIKQWESPKPLSRNEKRLKKLNRKMKRQVTNSKNYKKTKSKYARLHYRISCIRKDFTHKMTSEIVNNFDPRIIVIEDLSAKNMMKNSKLAKHIADRCPYETKRQLMYKFDKKVYNSDKYFIKVDRFFPSSQFCSNQECGHKNEFVKDGREIWTCEKCGTKHNRDVNACKNLIEEGIKLLTEGVAVRSDRDKSCTNSTKDCGDVKSISEPPLVLEGARL